MGGFCSLLHFVEEFLFRLYSGVVNVSSVSSATVNRKCIETSSWILVGTELLDVCAGGFWRGVTS